MRCFAFNRQSAQCQSKLIALFLTSVLPRVTRIIRSQKLLHGTGVEGSLCLLKAYEKRGKKGEGRIKPAAQSVRRLGAPSV